MPERAQDQPDPPDPREPGGAWLLGVPLLGDRAIDRAWMLLASVQVSFTAADWRAVHRRARVVEPGLHAAAAGRLRDAMTARRSITLQALSRAACQIVDDGYDTTPRPRLLPRHGPPGRDRRDAVARAVSDAVLAVALARHLEPLDVSVLASPLLETLRQLSPAVS